MSASQQPGDNCLRIFPGVNTSECWECKTIGVAEKTTKDGEMPSTAGHAGDDLGEGQGMILGPQDEGFLKKI